MRGPPSHCGRRQSDSLRYARRRIESRCTANRHTGQTFRNSVPHAGKQVPCWGLDVAKRHGLLQPGERVAGGNELLADVALITDLDKRLHDRLVGDLLMI